MFKIEPKTTCIEGMKEGSQPSAAAWNAQREPRAHMGRETSGLMNSQVWRPPRTRSALTEFPGRARLPRATFASLTGCPEWSKQC
jgi:hypothetical protein